jgi:hypothetical protein
MNLKVVFPLEKYSEQYGFSCSKADMIGMFPERNLKFAENTAPADVYIVMFRESIFCP